MSSIQQSQNSKPVRFLVFPKGKNFVRNFIPTDNILIVKQTLFQNWPSEFDPLENANQLRLIFSGKELKDEEILEDILHLSQCNSPVTIHLVVRRKVSVPSLAPLSQTESTSNPETETGLFDMGENIHFHGCCFDEEEAAQIKEVFQKKKGEDDKMAFTDAHIFLRSYWKWMATNNYHDHNKPFPIQHLMEVKKKVAPKQSRITCSEFRQIFFLFDNRTPCQVCPHGNKSRIQQATEQLHKALQPNTDFASTLFDSLWSQFQKVQDDTLSCQDAELLFYLYSVEISQN